MKHFPFSNAALLFRCTWALLAIGLCCCKNPQAPTLPPPGMAFVPGSENRPAFWMDSTPVTVAQFRVFVQATGFVTQAEKFGDAGVFDARTGSWGLQKGANWQYPLGPDGPPADDKHPVTQVSWDDAGAYCAWAGKRLPTRAEFSFAAAGGQVVPKTLYAWGDHAFENGRYKANFWQGRFPDTNTVADGFFYTSPVGYFGRNALGLSDMGGNVWQWSADWSDTRPGERAQCGGSFLCDPAVCHGFKIGGLSSSTPETSLMHVGFRGVRDAQ